MNSIFCVVALVGLHARYGGLVDDEGQYATGKSTGFVALGVLNVGYVTVAGGGGMSTPQELAAGRLLVVIAAAVDGNVAGST